jgi:hypothetical protein
VDISGLGFEHDDQDLMEIFHDNWEGFDRARKIKSGYFRIKVLTRWQDLTR